MRSDARNAKQIMRWVPRGELLSSDVRALLSA